MRWGTEVWRQPVLHTAQVEGLPAKHTGQPSQGPAAHAVAAAPLPPPPPSHDGQDTSLHLWAAMCMLLHGATSLSVFAADAECLVAGMFQQRLLPAPCVPIIRAYASGMRFPAAFTCCGSPMLSDTGACRQHVKHGSGCSTTGAGAFCPRSKALHSNGYVMSTRRCSGRLVQLAPYLVAWRRVAGAQEQTCVPHSGASGIKPEASGAPGEPWHASLVDRGGGSQFLGAAGCLHAVMCNCCHAVWLQCRACAEAGYPTPYYAPLALALHAATCHSVSSTVAGVVIPQGSVRHAFHVMLQPLHEPSQSPPSPAPPARVRAPPPEQLAVPPSSQHLPHTPRITATGGVPRVTPAPVVSQPCTPPIMPVLTQLVQSLGANVVSEQHALQAYQLLLHATGMPTHHQDMVQRSLALLQRAQQAVLATVRVALGSLTSAAGEQRGTAAVGTPGVGVARVSGVDAACQHAAKRRRIAEARKGDVSSIVRPRTGAPSH